MNWFDICILIVIVYSLFKGFKSGFIKQLASLIGLVAGAVLSGRISFLILPYIKEHTSSLAQPLSYIISFIFILIIFSIIGHMLHVILNTIKLGLINKLAGAVLCSAKWILIISIIINLITKIDTTKTFITDNFRDESKTFNLIQQVAPIIVPYLRFEI